MRVRDGGRGRGCGLDLFWIFLQNRHQNFGTESLLLGMALFVFICAGLVILIWRSGQAAVAGGHEIEEGTGKTPPEIWARACALCSPRLICAP